MKTARSRVAAPSAATAELADSLVYLYCIADAPRPPRLEAARGAGPGGVPGASAPRAIHGEGSIWYVVADVPAAGYEERAVAKGLADMDWVAACAVGHEEIVERAARAATVLPVKLLTLFSTEQRLLAGMGRLRRRILRSAGRVRGRSEVGVRVRFDPTRALRAAREEVVRAGDRGRGRSGAAGTAFLVRKQQEQTARRRLVSDAARIAALVHAELSAMARESGRQPIVGAGGAARLVLDGVYLVPSQRIKEVRDAVRRLARQYGPSGYHLELTGPWPPYHFVDIR